MIRIKAIYYCLKYGLLPYWLYEKECHYKGTSYLQHLLINIKYACVWITFNETEEDIEFEKAFNNNK
jgi:hypothetical protein